MNIDELREDNNGKLPTYADGGYPLYYLDGNDSVMCPVCANASLDNYVPAFRPAEYGINYEDYPLHCDQCGARIPSAYAGQQQYEREQLAMKAWEYRAATFDGLILCIDHFPFKYGPKTVTLESDGVYPIYVCEEWDSYPVCDACGREHDYVGLTSLSHAMAEYDNTEGSTNE